MNKPRRSSPRSPRYPDDVAWVVALNGAFWAVWPGGGNKRLGRCEDEADWAWNIGPWLRISGSRDVIVRNKMTDGSLGWSLVRNSSDHPYVVYSDLHSLSGELCCDENNDGITLEHARRNSMEVLVDEVHRRDRIRRGKNGSGNKRDGDVRGDEKTGR